jgi:molecular chaperone GrpE (heat shock protein)
MDGAGRDQIVDELRRGYRYEGRIIRYSLVQVANPRR